MNQHDKNEIIVHPTYTTEKSTQPMKKKHSFMKGLFGGVLGGFISVAIIVLLLMNQVITIPQLNKTEHSGEQTTQVDPTDPNIAPVVAEDADESDLSHVSEAVVGIINLQNNSVWDPQQEAGSGSGIVYKKENSKAYIVTNNHVVKNASEVEVDLNNEKRVQAKVIGVDELTDLAVLEVDGEHFPTVASLGSSDDLQVGSPVYAIGNPLGVDFSGSVTKGIISGLNRPVKVDTTGDRTPDWVMEVIQTDAAINPGNSGGALVNANGEVIGINSMKVNEQAVEGIGFAIPMDEAIPVIEQLENDGEVSRPFVGISGTHISQVPQQYVQNIQIPEDVEEGIVVANVQSGSPADDAGLQQYDFITEINGEAVTSMLDFKKYLYTETEVGDTIKFTFYRNGEKKTATSTLAGQ
ncbi:MAG TPA: trypsin-like peptidase domain-containing protein [Bacillota bacterium]|nr:trypsin-like peptidase domain-containing protein [Bacillota bacterium]